MLHYDSIVERDFSGSKATPLDPAHHTTSRNSSDSSSLPTTATNTNTSGGANSWTGGTKTARNSQGQRALPSLWKRSRLYDEDRRRDSALTSNTMNSTSTAGRESPVPASIPTITDAVNEEANVPAIIVSAEHNTSPPELAHSSNGLNSFEPPTTTATNHRNTIEAGGYGDGFQGITTDIPTGDFSNLFAAGNVNFSKRGSILLGGKRAARDSLRPTPSSQSLGQSGGDESADKTRKSASVRSFPQSSSQHNKEPTKLAHDAVAPSRILSSDEEILSRKVRSMYEYGNESAADLSSFRSSGSVQNEAVVEETDHEEGRDSTPSLSNSMQLNIPQKQRQGQDVRFSSLSNRRQSFITREPTEAAGGMEDWQDISGGDVDRYGFIVPKKAGSRVSSGQSISADPQFHRITTSLQLISETPRKKRSMRRPPSIARSTQSVDVETGDAVGKAAKKGTPVTGSIYSNRSGSSSATAAMSPFRVAANRLPYNRERRWVDEASDMLTLPPGLADIAEQEDDGKTAAAMKRKEWEREEKWRKMGRIAKDAEKGGGMVFVFDTRDSKLIDRTWKGIPDRWRAAAWWAFLEASASRRGRGSPGGNSADELIDIFHAAQEKSCVDDVQIDVDVPRTISSHIMFRRRYRGGQRLLFRVLHALSLHLPDIGYVQGMAALAATLLCYYDEEKAFVMMVRLWQLRGLDNLYRAGFGGLMEALDEFEQHWLEGGEVAKKLKEFNITSTAYGTRWYLTLFNYSIPFPAQLRVWDVFMLLGDAPAQTPSSAIHSASKHAPTTPRADLDVLHATSAALIDAEREILLDSDFENAMKVLTSWIPIKDEDFLMRVARAEYRRVRKKTGKSH